MTNVRNSKQSHLGQLELGVYWGFGIWNLKPLSIETRVVVSQSLWSGQSLLFRSYKDPL